MIPVMIVPILTGPQLLYRMLDSIDCPIARLVIIDNGDALNTSTGWPVEHVQRTSVIKMPANLGVAGSWNLGIKATPFAPWWLIVNHDVVFEPGALGQFATMAASDTLVLNGGPQPWCAFAIGEDVVRDVGLFDEGFHPGYFEDTDYERRCKARDAHPGFAPYLAASGHLITAQETRLIKTAAMPALRAGAQ